MSGLRLGSPAREPDRHEAGLVREARDKLQQEQLGQDAAARRRRDVEPVRVRVAVRRALSAAQPPFRGGREFE